MIIIHFCQNVTYVANGQVTFLRMSLWLHFHLTCKRKLNYHPPFTSELYLLNNCNLRLAVGIRIWQKINESIL